MPGIDLKRFPGITQKRGDFCLLACIENCINYFDRNVDADQFKLDAHFRKYINPTIDHPYFKYFAKYVNKFNDKYEGFRNTFTNIKDFITAIKRSLDNEIPIIFSLKSNVEGYAHIVIAYAYEEDLLRYFDPNNTLTNNYLTYKIEEIQQILKGNNNPDTLSIIPVED